MGRSKAMHNGDFSYGTSSESQQRGQEKGRLELLIVENMDVDKPA